jgi:two-component system cell cycle sensor histidine kinase/response regulator CckA
VDSPSPSASESDGIVPPEPTPSGERYRAAPGNPLLSQRLSRLTAAGAAADPELPPLPTGLAELQAQLQEARHSLLQWTRAETAWNGQRRLFKAVTEHVSDALAVGDGHGRRIWNNHAYLRLLRQPSEREGGAHSLFADVHPDDARLCADVLAATIESGQSREVDLRARRPDNSWAHLHACLIPIADSAGQVESIVLAARDQSEKKAMSEALALATRQSSSTGVTETMVRDLDQVVTSAFGNLTIAKNLNGPQNAVAVRLNEIERALQRARTLLEQLTTLSGHSGHALARVALEPLVQDIASGVLRGTLVRAEYQFHRRLPQVEIDTEAFTLALRNIITNSMQSMDRGVVRISAELQASDAIARYAPMVLKGGSYIHLSVQDQGHGMGERTLARAFEPSFTTRPGAKGLGLATARSAIQRIGGAINAQSTPGVGTIVHVYLPAPVDPATTRSGRVAAAATMPARRILLMDDEQMILDIVSRMLTHLGYMVKTSMDGAQAIAAFTKARQQDEPFDVVMMDLVIPNGIGGQEAAPTLKQIDPHAKIIASSGHLDHPVMKDHRKFGFTAVLEKPYKLERLQQVIEGVIAQEA